MKVMVKTYSMNVCSLTMISKKSLPYLQCKYQMDCTFDYSCANIVLFLNTGKCYSKYDQCPELIWPEFCPCLKLRRSKENTHNTGCISTQYTEMKHTNTLAEQTSMLFSFSLTI